MNIEWQKPTVIPEVKIGDDVEFWIAVETQRPDKPKEIITFLAIYQNRPLEHDDDGELISDDYLVTPDGDPHESIGWVTCKSHYEFDDFYESIEFNEKYKLLGWAVYTPPSFFK